MIATTHDKILIDVTFIIYGFEILIDVAFILYGLEFETLDKVML